MMLRHWAEPDVSTRGCWDQFHPNRNPNLQIKKETLFSENQLNCEIALFQSCELAWGIKPLSS